MNGKWYEDGSLNFAVGFEDTFIPQTRPGAKALDEYQLTGHYERWYDDIGLINQTGANQARWGIPWYLINPEPHRFRFDWLDRVIDRFMEIGVAPIIDLMHYGTPLWLDNGFINADYPQYVAEYAQAVAQRYADRVHDYTPLNEPLLNAMYCGQYGYWPPYLSGDDGFVKMLMPLTRGMLEEQAAIRAADPQAVIVNVEASFRFGGDRDAYRDEIDFLEKRRYIVEDLIMGKVGADHDLLPWLTSHGVRDDDLQWYRDHASAPDIMGVNHYPKVSTVRYAAGDPHSGAPDDPMPFQNDGVVGLKEVLHDFADRYGLPVYLTETCWPGSVAERIQWLHDSVQAVDELREEGMNLVGYTWWSLFDMMYWVYRDENKPAEHYLAEMGLWDLVPDGRGSFDRVRTDAVDTYRELVRRHRG